MLDQKICVLSIYRSQNRSNLENLVRDQSVRLYTWHLDSNDVGELELGNQVGSGPGARTTLLNRLLVVAKNDLIEYDWVIIADDDVSMPRAGLRTMLELALIAELQVCQPAMSIRSRSSHWLTIRRPWLAARQTSFVEIGPIVAFRSDVLDYFLPFPQDSGMGWGQDVIWHFRASEFGVRMGVIDAAPVVHKVKPGSSYVTDIEWARRDDVMSVYGVRKIRNIQQTIRAIPMWRLRISKNPAKNMYREQI